MINREIKTEERFWLIVNSMRLPIVTYRELPDNSIEVIASNKDGVVVYRYTHKNNPEEFIAKLNKFIQEADERLAPENKNQLEDLPKRINEAQNQAWAENLKVSPMIQDFLSEYYKENRDYKEIIEDLLYNYTLYDISKILTFLGYRMTVYDFLQNEYVSYKIKKEFGGLK